MIPRRNLMRAFKMALRDPGYDYLHWYITLVPRVTRTAGFELGSGMFINSALPEDSAAFLRSVSAE